MSKPTAQMKRLISAARQKHKDIDAETCKSIIAAALTQIGEDDPRLSEVIEAILGEGPSVR